jgi:hypothetical protein
MINLIPKEEKKRMTKDFYYRVALLFFVMLDFCILIAFIIILPSFLVSSQKDALALSKLETQKNEPIPLLGEQSLAEINGINSKLGVVESAEKNKFPLSQKVINAVLLNKRPDVKITQILYNNDPILGKKISITGTAPSREILLLFRQTLEDNPTFKNVDLPISNFIKGTNIQFSLSLIPA